MKTFRTIADFQGFLRQKKEQGISVGFVPTMGTLHEGHLSLVRKSLSECDITVCSIFVNPIQFNNKEDLEKYPRMIEKDSALLKEIGCDILFNPSTKEIYHEEVTEKYNFGILEQVMEGAFRPGHFNGVAVVVKRLFDIVKPDYSFFGEKDFQQLAIIKKLVEDCQLNIEIVGCDIIREDDGLAMSSRNLRLTKEQREDSTFIFKELVKARDLAKQGFHPSKVKKLVVSDFEKNSAFKLEYFEIADPITLKSVDSFDAKKPVRAFIAAYIGSIRLIDNIEIYF